VGWKEKPIVMLSGCGCWDAWHLTLKRSQIAQKITAKRLKLPVGNASACVVAIDGSKFKGVNNKDNKPTLKKLPFPIARVEKHTDNYRS
jgi:hypothetical protein